MNGNGKWQWQTSHAANKYTCTINSTVHIQFFIYFAVEEKKRFMSLLRVVLICIRRLFAFISGQPDGVTLSVFGGNHYRVHRHHHSLVSLKGKKRR